MAGGSTVAGARTTISKSSDRWGTTGETFRQEVYALWKHTKGRAKDPILYTIPNFKHGRDGDISMEMEVDLAEGFAFVAAVRKGVESVSATAIAMPLNPIDSLKVYVASNDKVQLNTKSKLESITSSMRELASQEISKDECKDQILVAVLAMNHTRINARLRTNKGARPIVLEGLQEILSSQVRPRRKSLDLSKLEARLMSLCQCLREYTASYKPNASIDNLRKLVLACHEFWSVPGSESTKIMLLRAGVDVDEARGDPHLRQIAKIAAYYHISMMMVALASRRQYEQLFRHISIRCVQAHDPVQMIVPKDVAGGGNYCRIHAEVQLVVELDRVKPSKWKAPRLIGSSKAACFLCDLFMQKHGLYFVPRSHGKLTPFWTIPHLEWFSKAQITRYKSIIKSMSKELHRLANMPHSQRLEAAMSWQALSRLEIRQISQASSRMPSPIPSVHSISAPSVISCVMEGRTSASALAITPSQNPMVVSASSPREGSTNDYSSISSKEKFRSNIVLNTLAHGGRRRNDLLPAVGTTNVEIRTHRSIKRSTGDLSMQPTSQQIRSSNDLDCEQRHTPVHTMRDHESRMCNVLPEYNASESNQMCTSGASYSVSTSRKFDFHDLELFFEFESPNTTNVVVLPGQEPNAAQSRIVNLTELVAGNELIVSFDGDETKERTLLLKLQDEVNDRYIGLTWQNVPLG